MANSEIATLGGGCFWCLEAVYNETRGVEAAISGYMGGPRPNPTYEEVCMGTTGHVEVVQVTFDPAVISFRDVLEIFFAIHDPTTLNCQGNDRGTQYRSVIFYHSAEQQAGAEEALQDNREPSVSLLPEPKTEAMDVGGHCATGIAPFTCGRRHARRLQRAARRLRGGDSRRSRASARRKLCGL